MTLVWPDAPGDSLTIRGARVIDPNSDLDGAFERLQGSDAEVVQEPTEQPYGIDAGFRDPSGNSFRVAQMG